MYLASLSRWATLPASDPKSVFAFCNGAMFSTNVNCSFSEMLAFYDGRHVNLVCR
jgi:hypothetical protein